MRKKSYAILLIIFWVTLIGKNALAEEILKEYKLLKGIEKVNVVVGELTEDAKKIGLTEERIQTVTELRLRKEGIEVIEILESTSPGICLYISIGVVGGAFSVSLGLNEAVYLERMPEVETIAATWHRGLTGTHGNSSDYIVTALSALIDQFLNDYYKANPKK